MNKRFYLHFFFLIFSLVLIACTSGESGSNRNIINDGMEMPTKVPVPEEFRDLQNPLEGTPQAIEQGEIIYQVNCASCHGVTGRGDGVVASSLEQRPTNLAADHENLSDGYLYWRIYAGGAFEPFRSVMPGWRSLLSEEDIWKVITYIRSLEG
jgi:mono/diheme cytochrome c family protein